MTTIKKYKFLILAISTLAAVYLYLNSSPNVDTNTNLELFTSESIKAFDGTDLTKPVYIAYGGYVYDVSPGRDDFYNEGKSYHYLTGKDSTFELNIAGGAIIKSKYKVVGIYQK